ncbi:Nif11-like leader peptide family natural product precursor [Rivularia sp. PCC 7116]|uniref:Nif11-like leader peptide family natural product precursor n=1 Tax=Rivularia sp. PCC 7116 TaxID=373994 RepID=UPI000A03CB00|nr:Nif11-like leader peptide family natural product precursor [Rivularia sp. PCC 7116]
MSIEAVNQFLEKVAKDSNIQEELVQAMQAENDRQAVVELGAKHGFNFTGDELMNEIEKRQKAAADSGELSEEELEAVAGGATPTFTTIVPIVTATAPVVVTIAKKVKW